VIVASNIVVVLPAHNEATTLGDVVRGIPKSIGERSVIALVVDDGSTDSTMAIARSAGALSDIKHLVTTLIEGRHDVVIGSRMLRPKGMPWSRVAANWLLNAITLVAYRGSVSDSQSGFKCFSRKALESIELTANGYDICSEIIGEMFSKKLSYRALPIKAVYTTYSRAKGQHFLNGVNIILHLFIRMMRRV
jgi:glycosyltransferase involved in cell wall biosynthesis